MSKESSIINYIKKEGVNINESIKEIDDTLILELKTYYNRDKKNLKTKVISLENKKERIKEFNITTICSLVMSAVAVIVSLWIASDNIINNKSYEILNNAMNQSYEIDSSLDKNRETLESFNDEYSKAIDDNNIQEIKRIENNFTFIKANENIKKLTKDRDEIFKRSKEQLDGMSKSWLGLNYIIVGLILAIIFIIIFSIYKFIDNRDKENKNSAIDLQTNIIKDVLEENNKIKWMYENNN